DHYQRIEPGLELDERVPRHGAQPEPAVPVGGLPAALAAALELDGGMDRLAVGGTVQLQPVVRWPGLGLERAGGEEAGQRGRDTLHRCRRPPPPPPPPPPRAPGPRIMTRAAMAAAARIPIRVKRKMRRPRPVRRSGLPSGIRTGISPAELFRTRPTQRPLWEVR